MSTHRVYFGKGEQTLRTVLHRRGRPLRVASATFAILDTRHPESSDDHILVAAGEPATIDALSTTLSARAGRSAASRRRIDVVTTAGVSAGSTYILEAADGRAEIVRIDAVASATQLLTAAEIAGDYPAGTMLRGVEVAAAFPADAADDEDNLLDDLPWLLVWSVDGEPPIRESIHLHRGEEAQLATLDDLLELDPHLAAGGGDRHEVALALARAHRDLRTDLALAGARETDLLVGPIGRDAVAYRAAWHLIAGRPDDASIRRAEDYAARYQELRGALQVGSKKPEVIALDKSDEVAVAINPAALFRPL